MLNANEIKKILYDMGADLCGIASIDRFGDAPEGYHPRDVLPSCESVIVFAKRSAKATLRCNTTVPYTIVRNLLTAELDRMSVLFCGQLEQHGIAAVPTGAVSHSGPDERTGRWRSIVSAKHSAVAAGLGWIGKNTLLITPEYGNMVWLCAVLTDAVLKPDPLLPGHPCENGCSLCIDRCPVGALGDPEMKQLDCFAHAFHVDGGQLTIMCHTCRSVCPHCLGSKNAQE